MRRLLNFCLLLVLVGAVGFLLYKAKLLPLGTSTRPTATPTAAAPVVARDSLRISVAHRPESLIVSALKRLLEAENLKVEIITFNPETSWMELAAGELDLVIAPVGEAVTAQARFQAGRFLFVSGVSEGYDTIIAKNAQTSAPKTLGVTGGPGAELFAIQKFPDSRLVVASDQQQLQAWLKQGAVQAAVLESAGLQGDLAQSGKKLGSTSAEAPMPTVVVLSRTLLEESEGTNARVGTLLKALDAWTVLIGYLASEPELLRSTLKQDAQQLGVDIDVLLKDYRFLTPAGGRDLLVKNQEAGGLKQTFDLLVLARTANLTAPEEWSAVLALPQYLAETLPGGLVSVQVSPTPDASTTPASSSATPTAIASAGSTETGTNNFPGVAPPDPWPESIKLAPIAQPLNLLPALTNQQVGVATASAFQAYGSDGKVAFTLADGGPLLKAPLADESNFYVLQAGQMKALDAKGAEGWVFEFEGTPLTDPILSPSDVVVVIESPAGYQVMAVSRETGLLSWQSVLAQPPASAPLFAASPKPTILLIDDKGGINTWNAQTGSATWQVALAKPTSLPPAVLGESLAVLDPAGGVRLLSMVDGSDVWDTNLSTSLAAPATLTENLVLIPSTDTYLYALDRETGNIAGKKSLASALSSPAVVVDDHVYCCDQVGGVHTLLLPDLELKSSVTLAQQGLIGPIFSDSFWALLATDGTLLLYPR